MSLHSVSGLLPNKKTGQQLARFRQINMDNAVTHHDALEFPDGQVVLLTRLCDGQRATVLQMPASARPLAVEDAAAAPAVRVSLRYRGNRARISAIAAPAQMKSHRTRRWLLRFYCCCAACCAIHDSGNETSVSYL